MVWLFYWSKNHSFLTLINIKSTPPHSIPQYQSHFNLIAINYNPNTSNRTTMETTHHFSVHLSHTTTTNHHWPILINPQHLAIIITKALLYTLISQPIQYIHTYLYIYTYHIKTKNNQNHIKLSTSIPPKQQQITILSILTISHVNFPQSTHHSTYLTHTLTSINISHPLNNHST